MATLTREQLGKVYGGRCPVYRCCAEPPGANPDGCEFCRMLLSYFEHKEHHDLEDPPTWEASCDHCVDTDGLIRRHTTSLDRWLGWKPEWGPGPTDAAIATAREFLADLGPAWSESVTLSGDRKGGLFLENSVIGTGELSVDVDEQGALTVVLPELDDNPDGTTFTRVNEAVVALQPFLTPDPPLLLGAQPEWVKLPT